MISYNTNSYRANIRVRVRGLYAEGVCAAQTMRAGPSPLPSPIGMGEGVKIISL